MKIAGLSILVLFFLFASCRNMNDKHESVNSPQAETLIKINRYLVKEDAERIMKVGERKGWKLTKHNSGLFYQILEHGNGTKPGEGDKVTYSYKTELLNGDYCFSSDSNGYRSFRIDKSKIEPGWNELSKELVTGDSVLMILPPYLGYGLAGDGGAIPPRSILVYHMRLIRVE